MKTIDTIYIEGYSRLSDLIHKVSESGHTVCCVMPYEKVFKLLGKLLKHIDEIKLGSIHLQNEDYCGYNHEYYVTLDSDMYLDIEPVRNTGDDKHSIGYCYNEADVYLFDGDVKASILGLYQNKICYELNIELDDNSNEDFVDETLEIFKFIF